MLRVVLLAAAFFCTQVVFHGSAASAHQESKVYICPMHPEVQSSTPGKCPKCKMSLVVQQPPAATSPEAADAYVCPMHPEIRSGSPGKCPKCAMPLVPAIPAIGDDFELIVECTPRAPVPGEKAKLRFAVFNPKTREQVKEFAVMHDKLFHVFIISQDLTQFQHIHPRLGDDGSFTVEAVLPAAGRYKVYSDFYPVDGAPQVLQTSIATAGYKSDLLTSEARLTPDATAAKIVTGSKVPQDEADKLGVVFDRLKPGGANAMKVELTIEPYELIAGRPATLKFHLTDAKSGALLGACSLSHLHPTYLYCNLGYWVRTSQRGRGIAEARLGVAALEEPILATEELVGHEHRDQIDRRELLGLRVA